MSIQILIGFICIYYSCMNLKTIYVGNNWNIDNVENKSGMFSNCGTSRTTPKN